VTTAVGIFMVAFGLGLWLGYAIRDAGARFEQQMREARARRYHEEPT
jgi:hypothetical protein